MQKPLAGTRVLDISRLLPGPLCTMQLADLGADVIKIEDLQQGDYMRYIPPMANQYSYLFSLVNRNKRAIKIDFTRPEGRETLLKLAETADVWVESYRPGVMEKMGLDYETIRARNPKIVYCSITGYGRDGRYANLAGHDLNFCALTGILDQIGEANRAPALYNFQIGDIVGGSLTAALSILAALIGRGQSGEGRFLDVSIYAGTLYNMVIPTATVLAEGAARARGTDILTGALAIYNVYTTSDGRALVVASVEEKFWTRFCAALERPDLLRYHTAIGEGAEYLKAELQSIIGQKTFAYWEEKFEGIDCCVSPVLTLDEAMTRTPELFIETEHPTEGLLRYMPFPVPEMDGGEAPRPAPAPGEHTLAILQEAGFDAAAVQDLREKKIIW